jgi:hypothetical protein
LGTLFYLLIACRNLTDEVHEEFDFEKSNARFDKEKFYAEMNNNVSIFNLYSYSILFGF